MFDELVTLPPQQINNEIDEIVHDTRRSNYNERDEKDSAGTVNHLNSYAVVRV